MYLNLRSYLDIIRLCIFLIATVKSVKSGVISPSQINATEGDEVIFKWNTTGGITTVFFGLRSGDNILPERRLIKVEGSTVTLLTMANNTQLYRGRVDFTGNLAVGHAWFKVSSLMLTDDNQYVASILEDGALGYSPYYAILTVKEKPTAKPTTTDTDSRYTSTTPPPKTPVITTKPSSQTASRNSTVTFECEAEGKPKPIITWEKFGSSEQLPQGSPLNITDFKEKDVGVYKCTARSKNISKIATAEAYVQFSTCATELCTKKLFDIEFLNFTYTLGYGNPNSVEYQELKITIELACLALYARKGRTLYTCTVLSFSNGSIVAVVEVGAPTSMTDPWTPLQEAIKTGKFANHRVNTDFGTPEAPANPPTPPKFSNWEIFGIVIGAIILVGVIVIAIVIIFKKKDKRGKCIRIPMD